jgi:hypothetical protein
VPPSQLHDNVDPILEKICLRALEKSRDGRYASARQMRAELRAVLEAHGAHLPPIPSARTGSGGTERVSHPNSRRSASDGTRRPNATVGFEANPSRGVRRSATVGFDQRDSGPITGPISSARPRTTGGNRAIARGTVGFESAGDAPSEASAPTSARTVERRAATLAQLPVSIKETPAPKKLIAPERREHDREAATMATPAIEFDPSLATNKTESRSEAREKTPSRPPGTFVPLSSNEIQVMVDEKESSAVAATPPPKPKSRKAAVIAFLVLGAAGVGAYLAKAKTATAVQQPAQQVEPTVSAPAPNPSVTQAPTATQVAMPAPTPAPTAELLAPEPEPTASGKPTKGSKAIAKTAKTVAEPKTAAAAPTPEPPPVVTATAAPTPTPVATAAPAPTPTPTPVVTAAPPKPAFDPATAAVAMTGVSTTNGLNGSNVRSALSHVNFTKCYRDALTAKGAPASGTATLSISISESGYITGASLGGAGFLPAMKGCIESAARSAKVKDVDTGEATANVTLSFSHK